MADVGEDETSATGQPAAGTWRWQVREELSTGVYEYSLYLPDGFDNIDIATAHVERDGGDSKEDWNFRLTLYYLIGAGVVKSGQIEDAMKQLVTLVNDRKAADFSVEDADWMRLHRELKECAQRDGPNGNTVSAAIGWAEDHHIKKIRDDLVHANWWDFAGIDVRRTRFARRKKGAILSGNLSELKREIELLGQYELMLDECIGRHWPRAYVFMTVAQKRGRGQLNRHALRRICADRITEAVIWTRNSCWIGTTDSAGATTTGRASQRAEILGPRRCRLRPDLQNAARERNNMFGVLV